MYRECWARTITNFEWRYGTYEKEKVFIWRAHLFNNTLLNNKKKNTKHETVHKKNMREREKWLKKEEEIGSDQNWDY